MTHARLVGAAVVAATLGRLGVAGAAPQPVVDAAPAGVPAVDPADLPPLPSATDDASSAATVLAASDAGEDVVVGAAKREQSLGNVASAVTVITADRIRRFGYRTVSEAIAGVAGIYIQDTRLTQQVGVRGVQIPGGFNSRILVLVDGATVNEAWGGFAGVTYDSLVSIEDISRIEVIRGPVGAVYGSNAFFGILNIVTKSATEQAHAWGHVGISSINGEVASAGFAQGGVNKQVRGSIYALNRIGDTSYVPEIGSGLDGDGGNSFVGSLVGTYNGSFLQVRGFRSSRDSPFAPYDSDPKGKPPYTLLNYQLLVEGGHTLELSKRATVVVRAYGTLYRYADRIHKLTEPTFLDFGDAKTVGAEARLRYELVDDGKLGITAGGEANYNQTESRAYDASMNAADGVVVPLDFDVEGTYAELDGQPTAWLGFTGGVRFDRNSKISSRVSPRAALFFSQPMKSPRYGLKLLYAEGFRNPSAFEGFFDDGVDFAANPKIQAETIRSFEAVAWAKPAAGLSTRLSGYYWDANDVIEQVPITVPDPTDPMGAPVDRLQFKNVGRYITDGIEAEASYRNSGGWYAFGGGTYAHVGNAEAGGAVQYGNVVNAPALTAVGGVSTPRLRGLAHVSTDVTILGPRSTRVATVDSPAWVGWNAALYFPSVRHFNVTLGVHNIIGRRDRIPAPGDYDRNGDAQPVIVPRIPGEGREVYVKVGYAY